MLQICIENTCNTEKSGCFDVWLIEHLFRRTPGISIKEIQYIDLRKKKL